MKQATIAVVVLAGLFSNNALAEGWFTEDFNDGDADGWTTDFMTSLVHEVTFPTYAGRGAVLRYEGHKLALIKDDFAFPGSDYVVEFEARMLASVNLGSDHVGWRQYYSAEDNREVMRRHGEYNDMYVWEPGPGHGQVWLANPATPVTDWTAYRTVRSGDHYEVFYGVPGSGVWNSLGTYDAHPGSMASGGEFHIWVGGTIHGDECMWEVDNVSVTPEPATLGLLSLGGLALLKRRKRQV